MINTTGSQPSKSFKMKPMEFPSFNGKRRDWPAFYNVWKNIVEPQGYSQFFLAQQLLKSVEKGTIAADLVRAVTLRDESSYQLMWNRLLEYFQDQGAVLATLYNDLDSLKPVKNDEPREIIKLANELELIHESLFSISSDHPKKINVNRNDRLVALLPEHLQTKWNDHFSELDPKVRDSPFSEFVVFMCKERSKRLRFYDINPKSGVKNASSHHTDTKQSRVPECWLDSSHTGHWARNCKLWGALKPEERRHVCLEKKRCLMCLDSYSKGHKCPPIPKHVYEKLKCKDSSCKFRHRFDVACKSIESSTDGVDVQTGCISSFSAFTARYAVQVQGVKNTVPLFADNGSDLSFVNHDSAVINNYKEVGRRTLNVKTINGTRKVQSKLFEIPIVTADRIEKVVCHSVPDPLTSEGSPVDLSMLRKCFPTYKNIEKLQKDTRPAEILLGIDVFELHP